MNFSTPVAPLHVLCLSARPVDLSVAPYGPFIVHEAADLADVTVQIQAREHDAVLVVCADEAEFERLVSWPGLSHTVLDAALVLVAPEPRPATALRLVQAGVQDVLPLRPGDHDQVARALRLSAERKRLELTARRAYSTDLATGLPNHAQLMEHMTHLLALREREPASMALIAVRVDGFAATEGSLGAEAANVLRRKVAVRIRASLRASDVVASINGDLFAVLLAWIDAPSDAEGVARKLSSSLAQPLNVAGHDVLVSTRIGLSQYPIHGRDAGSLMRRALGQATAGQIGRLPGLGSGAAANDDFPAG